MTYLVWHFEEGLALKLHAGLQGLLPIDAGIGKDDVRNSA